MPVDDLLDFLEDDLERLLDLTQSDLPHPKLLLAVEQVMHKWATSGRLDGVYPHLVPAQLHAAFAAMATFVGEALPGNNHHPRHRTELDDALLDYLRRRRFARGTAAPVGAAETPELTVDHCLVDTEKGRFVRWNQSKARIRPRLWILMKRLLESPRQIVALSTLHIEEASARNDATAINKLLKEIDCPWKVSVIKVSEIEKNLQFVQKNRNHKFS